MPLFILFSLEFCVADLADKREISRIGGVFPDLVSLHVRTLVAGVVAAGAPVQLPPWVNRGCRAGTGGGNSDLSQPYAAFFDAFHFV